MTKTPTAMEMPELIYRYLVMQSHRNESLQYQQWANEMWPADMTLVSLALAQSFYKLQWNDKFIENIIYQDIKH